MSAQTYFTDYHLIQSFLLPFLKCRENLFLDDIYGLVIVFVSLLGFISLVWLKDQLGNGRGPAWLENDQRAANRVRMREAQHRVNALRRHLDEAGERARVRQQAPDRVAAAKEVSEFQDKIYKELKALKKLQRPQFTEELERLRLREMEITFELGMSHWRYQFLLKEAREKRGRGLDKWRSNAFSKMMARYRAGDDTSPPPEETELPTDESLGLTQSERSVIQLYWRKRRELGQEEQETLRGELRELSERRKVVLEEHHTHQSKIAR